MLRPQEIGRWFESEAPGLVLYARRWFGQAEAEEVVQEAFMKLIQQRRAPRQVRAWLYATVRNQSISSIRSSVRRHAREEGVLVESPAWFESHPGDFIDAGLAEEALQALPGDEREVIILRIWARLTLKEIARVIGVSPPTALRKYRSALGRLRKEMQPCTTNPI